MAEITVRGSMRQLRSCDAFCFSISFIRASAARSLALRSWASLTKRSVMGTVSDNGFFIFGFGFTGAGDSLRIDRQINLMDFGKRMTREDWLCAILQT